MVKSYGVVGGGGGGPGHFTVSTGTGRSFDSRFSILNSQFSILDSRFSILFPGPRSQVPSPSPSRLTIKKTFFQPMKATLHIN